MTFAMHPYRSPSPAARDARPRFFERDLGVAFVLVWLGSVARVVVGVARHQPFGAELTLAAFAVVLIPALAHR